MATSRKGAGKIKPRRKSHKNVIAGAAHIKSTFNNTIISITDAGGQVIPGLLLARLASRARASRPRSPLRWQPRPQAVAPWSTV